MSNKERLYLFDTTLRDGVQTIGVDFSLEDKLLIAETLDALGVDYIEGGYPGANPVDTALFENRRLYKNASFTAFGMTKRAGRSVSLPQHEDGSRCRWPDHEGQSARRAGEGEIFPSQ